MLDAIGRPSELILGWHTTDYAQTKITFDWQVKAKAPVDICFDTQRLGASLQDDILDRLLIFRCYTAGNCRVV